MTRGQWNANEGVTFTEPEEGKIRIRKAFGDVTVDEEILQQYLDRDPDQ